MCDLRTIKVNKNTVLNHQHMYINGDTMYISDVFAKMLLSNYDILEQKSYTTGYGVSYNYDINFCSIQFQKITERNIKGHRYSWYVTGVSGSKGFDEYYYSKKERLDLRIKYKIHKEIIKHFYKSKLSRLDKIKSIMNASRNRK